MERYASGEEVVKSIRPHFLLSPPTSTVSDLDSQNEVFST